MPDLRYSISLAVQGAMRSLDQFDMKLKRAGTSLKSMALPATAGAVAITGAFALSIKKFSEFDQKMRYVNTIAKLNEQQFKALSKQVLALSNELAKPAPEVAAGMYQTLSSGFEDTADAIKIMHAAGQAAIAGNAEMGESVKVITGALNAYDMGAEQATRVSDILFKTVEKGVVEFPELAQSLGEVTAISGQLAIPLEEIGAAIAALTVTGQPAAIAMTGLQNALSNYLKPSAAASKLAKQLGLDMSVAHIKAVGFQGALKELTAATKGNEEKMAVLFGGIRELRAVLPLTGAAADEFIGSLEDIKNSAGATAAAVGEQEKGLARQFQRLTIQVQNLFIELGENLAPAVRVLTQSIGGLSKAFAGLSEIAQNILLITGGLTAVFLGVTAAVIKLGPFVLEMAGAIEVFGSTIGGLLVAAAPVIAILAGVAAAITTLWLVSTRGERKFRSEWQGIMDTMGQARSKVQESWMRIATNPEAIKASEEHVKRYGQTISKGLELGNKDAVRAAIQILKRLEPEHTKQWEMLATAAITGYSRGLRMQQIRQQILDELSKVPLSQKGQQMADEFSKSYGKTMEEGLAAGSDKAFKTALRVIMVSAPIEWERIQKEFRKQGEWTLIEAAAGMKQAVPKIGAVTRDAGERSMQEFGTGVIAGFKKYVTAPFKWVNQQIKDLADDMVFGRHSPTLREYGEMAMQEIADGMRSRIPVLTATMREAMTGISSTMDTLTRDFLRKQVFPAMPERERGAFFGMYAPTGKIAPDQLTNALNDLIMIFERLRDENKLTTDQMQVFAGLVALTGQVTGNLQQSLYGAADAMRDLGVATGNIGGMSALTAAQAITPMGFGERVMQGARQLAPGLAFVKPGTRMPWWWRPSTALSPEAEPRQVRTREQEIERLLASMSARGAAESEHRGTITIGERTFRFENGRWVPLPTGEENLQRMFGGRERTWEENVTIGAGKGAPWAVALQRLMRETQEIPAAVEPALGKLKERMSQVFQDALRDSIVRGGSIFENFKTAFKAAFSSAFAEGLLAEGSPLKKAMDALGGALTEAGSDFAERIMKGRLGKFFEDIADRLQEALEKGGMLTAIAIMGAISILSRRGPKTLGSFVSAAGQGYVLGGPIGAGAGIVLEAARSRSAQLSPAYAPVSGYPSGGTRVVSINQNNYFAHESDPIRSAYDIGRIVESRRW